MQKNKKDDDVIYAGSVPNKHVPLRLEDMISWLASL